MINHQLIEILLRKKDLENRLNQLQSTINNRESNLNLLRDQKLNLESDIKLIQTEAKKIFTKEIDPSAARKQDYKQLIVEEMEESYPSYNGAYWVLKRKRVNTNTATIEIELRQLIGNDLNSALRELKSTINRARAATGPEITFGSGKKARKIKNENGQEFAVDLQYSFAIDTDIEHFMNKLDTIKTGLIAAIESETTEG